MSETDIDELARAVDDAVEDLYSYLDAYGATKKVTHVIARLIDAKVSLALAEFREANRPPLP